MIFKCCKTIHVERMAVPGRIFWISVEVERAKHAQNLPDIANQSAGAEIDHAAVPLDTVMLRRIPDKKIAYRRIRGLCVAGRIEGGSCDLIENGTTASRRA